MENLIQFVKSNYIFTPSKQNLSCFFKNKELKNKIDIENNCVIIEKSLLMITLHKLPYTSIALLRRSDLKKKYWAICRLTDIPLNGGINFGCGDE